MGTPLGPEYIPYGYMDPLGNIVHCFSQAACMTRSSQYHCGYVSLSSGYLGPRPQERVVGGSRYTVISMI